MSKEIEISTVGTPVRWLHLSGMRWYLFTLTLAAAMGIGAAFGVKYAGVWALVIIPIVLILIGVIALPDVGLPIFVFVIYINLSANLITYFGLPSVAKAFVALLSLVLVIRAVLFREEIRGLTLPVILLGAYTLTGAITLVYLSDFTAGYKSLVEYLKIAYYSILVVAFIQKPEVLRKVIWMLLFAGILMGTISLFQFVTGTTENTYWGFGQSITSDTGTGYRVGGAVGDPNYYAMIMAVLVPIAFERFWSAKATSLRIFAGWALIVCVLAVLYTYSRGGFVAMSIGVLIMAIRYKLRLLPALVGVSFVLVIYQFLPANYTDRLSTLLYFLPQSTKQQLVDRSIRSRTSENLVAWEMFKQHPITGVGMSNYEDMYYVYARPMGIDMSGGTHQPHNLYLQILAERGMLGLVIFLIIIFITFRNLARSEKYFLQKNQLDLAGITGAIATGLTVYLFASIFLHDSFIRYFWILIGIAWSIPQLVSDERSGQALTTSLKGIYYP